MKNFLLVVVLSLAVNLFALSDSKIDKMRFKSHKGVLTDTFVGIEWENNKKLKATTQSGAKKYCNTLILNNKNDWRLPTIEELKHAYKIRKYFILVSKKLSGYEYSNQTYRSSEYKKTVNAGWGVSSDYYKSVTYKKTYLYADDYSGTRSNLLVRCIRGKKYYSLYAIEKEAQKIKKSKIFYQKVKNNNTIASYELFIQKYPNAYETKEIKKILTVMYKKEYQKIQDSNNIVAYELFVKSFPNAPQCKEAIKKIHKLVFAEAKRVDTISAYNTFIISYPYAKEVKEAIEKSYNLENTKYDKIEKEEEIKARLLAVKIKKMTFRMKKQSKQMGYEIVIDRMSRLLTQKYEETDASLRYYESKEFTDFTQKFDSTMKEIKKVLNKIESNTATLGDYAKEMVTISKQGFTEAKADRAMTAYYTQQHREWEKSIHSKDKGYN